MIFWAILAIVGFVRYSHTKKGGWLAAGIIGTLMVLASLCRLVELLSY